ncbi:MAG: hypothetical protein RSE93_08205 [Oscillospiraceae bacterium]
MKGKISTTLAIGLILYTSSKFLSHIDIFPFWFENANAFISGAGAGLVLLGIIPQHIKSKIHSYKEKIFIQ